MKSFIKLTLVAIAVTSSCNALIADNGFKNHIVSKVVVFHNDTVKLKFVHNRSLFAERWDTLAQPRFWQNVICLSPDSCIVNVASSRKELQKISFEEWKCQQESEKENYRGCLRNNFNLGNNESIFVTTGKKEFYEYKKVVPMINTAVDVFLQQGVDPWYAQTILLIESPGKSQQKSSVGAYGPFQLMKAVARKYGLVVSKYRDDRSNLNKSALAASKLLGLSFIPKVKAMLDEKNIRYNETDLWFRLLVMHAYHAGPGNVQCVIDEINPREGGISLFNKIWSTECRGFKNESQNYSQIALASLVQFEKIIQGTGDTVFMVQGDVLFSKFKRNNSYTDMSAQLKNCLKAYQNDLVEGTIPFEYFTKKIYTLQRELTFAETKNSIKQKSIASYPLNSEEFVKLGEQLLRKRKVDDAVKVFKLNVEKNPDSAIAYDSLGRAYKMMGKNDLAIKCINKSAALKGGKGASQ